MKGIRGKSTGGENAKDRLSSEVWNIDREISRAAVIDFTRSISPVNHCSFTSCRTLSDELSSKYIARELRVPLFVRRPY